jgi:hypothetical protein
LAYAEDVLKKLLMVEAWGLIVAGFDVSCLI